MNRDIDDIQPFDNPRHEREWLAQESAMRRERLHLDPAGDDARSRRYRLLTRVLRIAPPGGLPADFAQRVSAQVAAPAQGWSPAMGFERVLTTLLVSVLLLAAVVVTLLYGAAWWPSFEVLLPARTAAHWLLALGACLGLSWMVGAWTDQGRSPGRKTGPG